MYITLLLINLITLATACGVEDRTNAPPKTAIVNVKVWNGACFGQETTVVLSGGIITNANPAGATIVNGNGGYLIPGLIDSHCHIQSCSYLTAMRQYGVTTALDMGTYPISSVTACKASGVTDVRGPGAAGTVNGTTISHFPGFPSDSFLPNVSAGIQFVANRIAQGADYIKVFLDPLGPSDEVLTAVVNAAHEAGKLVITHAPSYADYSQAEVSGADIPCHAPLDAPIDAASIANLTNGHRRVVVPTLIMMQSIVNNTHLPFSLYTANAEASVTNMYKAGVPICVGTDANLSPYTPANPPFGISMHEELQLLVQAGLSPKDALIGATSLAANTFGLHDRGSILPGLRADLVLLSADPTVNIKNTLSIEKVWVDGVEFDPTS